MRIIGFLNNAPASIALSATGWAAVASLGGNYVAFAPFAAVMVAAWAIIAMWEDARCGDSFWSLLGGITGVVAVAIFVSRDAPFGWHYIAAGMAFTAVQMLLSACAAWHLLAHKHQPMVPHTA